MQKGSIWVKHGQAGAMAMAETTTYFSHKPILIFQAAQIYRSGRF
jgi:hypothetical protein